MKSILLVDLTEHYKIFQSIVFVKVQISQLGAVNTYTPQCILTGNTLYEKIFSIIYCLLLISAAVTIMDLGKWIITYIIKGFTLSNYLKQQVSKDLQRYSSADLFLLL